MPTDDAHSTRHSSLAANTFGSFDVHVICNVQVNCSRWNNECICTPLQATLWGPFNVPVICDSRWPVPWLAGFFGTTQGLTPSLRTTKHHPGLIHPTQGLCELFVLVPSNSHMPVAVLSRTRETRPKAGTPAMETSTPFDGCADVLRHTRPDGD